MLRGTHGLSGTPRSTLNAHHPHHHHNHSASAPQLNNSSDFSMSSSNEIPYSLSLTHLELTVTCLWLLTPLLATISITNVIIAVATNSWLETEEKMKNPVHNGTVGESLYLAKLTISGLWTLCYTNRK